MLHLRRNRRAFLRDAAAASAGLAIAIHVPGCANTPRRGTSNDFEPNAFLRVTPDDRIVFTLARVEMGQGTMTSETMLVAEELYTDPSLIDVEHAPAHDAYGNPEYIIQSTGGSNSTRSSWKPLRKAGAIVREALLGAAAAKWAVPRDQVRMKDKVVTHGPTGRTTSIGALVELARDHVDGDAAPKPRSEWTLIGTSPTRLDAQRKVDGTAIFGADPEPDDVEVAIVLHGPIGSRLERFDASEAESMPGVKTIFEIPSGVAIVADRYHRARKAAKKVKPTWSKSDVSSAKLFEEYEKTVADDAGDTAASEGDAEDVIEAASDVIEAEYRLPFLAHVTMEPMTATVHVKKDGTCEIWTPTQMPGFMANAASNVTGISTDDITVHQTLIGGAFGRKSYADAVIDAAHIAKRRDAPVRLMWSREDDVKRDIYRPASYHRVRAALDGDQPVAWAHRMMAQSAMFTEQFEGSFEEVMPGFMTGMALWGAKTFVDDNSVVEGAKHMPYAIPNREITYHVAKSPVPGGIWRSVAHSQNGFVVETFIDELATRAGADPVAFRKKLLADRPRHAGVLELAAKKAGWGDPLSAGRARGVAVHESFHSYCAAVVEVSIEDRRPVVHRIVAAVDCGTVINPDGVHAQIEGGLIYGLSSAITNEAITIDNGEVQQSNFHDFEVLRMHETPEIEVHVVESTEPPSGVGEIAVPPIAPAVANGLFVLTKKRIRQMPFPTV